MTHYDENFGFWNDHLPMDEEDIAFYDQVQDENVEKKCAGCCRMVKILPAYDYCNSCATIMERGGDLPFCDEESDE